jgi:glycopeptide antibiotics resistance protein
LFIRETNFIDLIKIIHKHWRIVLWVILILYCTIIIWLLFFRVGSTQRELYFTSKTLHLIPFESTYHSIKLAITNNFEAPHKAHYRFITARNILGNILLFLPWSMLAPLLFFSLRSIKMILISTIIFSGCAEIVQYFFVIGVADIDDVLLNTIGSLIGYKIQARRSDK